MPPKIIIIQVNTKGLEEFENAANEMLQQYYDRSPTGLKGVHSTEQDKSDQAYYNALVQSMMPDGKRVV